MAYDNTDAEIQNPNTTFRQPPPDPAPVKTTTVVAPEQRQALAPALPSSDGAGTYSPEQIARMKQGGDFPAPSGSRGPSQGAVTVQSEPTPQVAKPPIDPRPWAWVQKKSPQIHEWIDNAANATGV